MIQRNTTVEIVRRALLLGIATLAIFGALVVPTYAYLTRYSWYPISNGLQPAAGKMLMPHEFRRFGLLRTEITDEFKQKVMSIVNADPDVKNLLNNGYNVTNIRPIVRAVVQGSGEVTIKATGAVVTLTREKSGFASVQVDLEAGKVTRIDILSKATIKKTP